MNLDNLKERLTKKLGPLPIWVWALIAVGVGYVAYRYARGSSNSTAIATEDYDDTGSIDDTPLDDGAFPGAGSGSGSNSGGGSVPIGGGTSGTTYVPYEPEYDDSSRIGVASWGDDPGYDPTPIDWVADDPNLHNPTTTTAPVKESRNTQLVNERLRLAERAASEGNLAAAQNYARAALAYSRSETSTANINNIIKAYGGAPMPAPAPAKKATAAKATPKKASAAPAKKTAVKKATAAKKTVAKKATPKKG